MGSLCSTKYDNKFLWSNVTTNCHNKSEQNKLYLIDLQSMLLQISVSLMVYCVNVHGILFIYLALVKVMTLLSQFCSLRLENVTKNLAHHLLLHLHCLWGEKRDSKSNCLSGGHIRNSPQNFILLKIENTDNWNGNAFEEPFRINRGQPVVFHALLPLLVAQLYHCFSPGVSG